MIMTTSPRDEFIDIISKNCQVDGFDELTSKIVGTLFIEPTEVALEDLAKMTGYSLSAVSTAMKLVVRTGLVKRMKKPGSPTGRSRVLKRDDGGRHWATPGLDHYQRRFFLAISENERRRGGGFRYCNTGL